MSATTRKVRRGSPLGRVPTHHNFAADCVDRMTDEPCDNASACPCRWITSCSSRGFLCPREPQNSGMRCGGRPATGRHAQSTTQVTTGNAFARLRTCQHRRHELFHLHPILCRLPLARHRSFSILTTQFDRLEPCAVKRPRRAVDAARGTVWTRRGAVTLLTHTLWRWRPFSQLLRPVRVPRMLLRQARGQVPRAVHAERVLHFNRCFVSSFPGTSVLRADPNGFSHR